MINNFYSESKPGASTRVQTSSHRSHLCCQRWVLPPQIKLTSDTLGSETGNKVFQITLWSHPPWTLKWQLMQTQRVTQKDRSEVLFWTITMWLFSHLCLDSSSIRICIFLSTIFLSWVFFHTSFEVGCKNGTMCSGLSWLKQQAPGQTAGLLFALEKPSVNGKGGYDQSECGQSQEDQRLSVRPVHRYVTQNQRPHRESIGKLLSGWFHTWEMVHHWSTNWDQMCTFSDSIDQTWY